MNWQTIFQSQLKLSALVFSHLSIRSEYCLYQSFLMTCDFVHVISGYFSDELTTNTLLTCRFLTKTLNAMPCLLGLCVLLFFSAVRAQSPDIHFSHISTGQGLSNSTIEAIVQDNRGFVWVGTRDGLNRYDGTNVMVYKNLPDDSSSLSDNFITSLYEDARQQLWVGTRNGLNVFDPKTNRFKHLTLTSNDARRISQVHIATLFGNAKQQIWIGTKEGQIYKIVSGVLQPVQWRTPVAANNPVPELFVQVFFEDNRGILWAGTEDGLYQYNHADNVFEKWREQPLAGKQLSVRAMAQDKQGNLLLGTAYHGLVIYNPGTGINKHFVHTPGQQAGISSNMVIALSVNKKGEIWIGCVNGGLDKYDPVAGTFQHYYYQPEKPNSLSQRTVSVLYTDRQENLWIGTHRGGLNLYAPGAKKFISYRQHATANSLSYNDVKAFCEDSDGEMWIGTDGGGLDRYNRREQTFVHYKYDPQNANSIGSNEVLSILEDSRKQLWIATWGGGLCRFDKRTNRFTRYQTTSKQAGTLGSDYVQCMVEDKPGRLYVGTYFGGLFVFDTEKEIFTPVAQSATTGKGVTGNNVVALMKDKAGNIWVGTDDGGLNKIDAATGAVVHYFNQSKKKPDIRILFTDSKGNIWVGQQGLYVYQPHNKQFEIFTHAEGLSSLFIKGIVEDNNGNLWISTSYGLKKLNPGNKAVRSYNSNDGLQDMEFEANAAYMTKDGEVFMGGINGFNRFYPNEIKENSYLPPVYVTELWVHNQPVLGGRHPRLQNDISYSRELTLTYDSSTFTLGFAALNYTTSENNQFLYKLDNWDKDWLPAGKEQKATYTNLPPGKYRFVVKAANNDGIWNDKGYELLINITPPFWATWWFRLLMAAGLLATVYYIYRVRKRMIHQWHEEEKKEAIHQMQLDFFTNISHEFRTPLSLITGPVESLLKQETDEKTKHVYQVIQRNANRLLQLITELIDFRKAKSGSLRLQVMAGNIPMFIEEIAEEFSELSKQKKINFHVSAKIDWPQECWFDRQVLEKIIINLLSNAFKYTQDNGSISLEVLNSLEAFKPQFESSLLITHNNQQTDFVYFRIADNGTGISKASMPHLFERYYRVSDAHLGSGIGLAFVKTLTQLHKGNIYVYSEYGKGTEIIVGIPATQQAYPVHEQWINPKPLVSMAPFSTNQMTSDPLNSADVTVAKTIAPTKRNTILVADDNEDLRSFLTDSLAPFYTIIEASNGEEALQKTRAQLPDLIISDIMMPVMDGIAFCQQAKSIPDIAHIPFVLLTAKHGPETRQEGTESGADYYFTKPVSIDLLLATIRNIFTQRNMLRQLYRNDQLAEVKAMAQTTQDKEFLAGILAIIENNLSKTDMDIDFVCTQIGMSRTKLYNKMKAISGQPIGDFIRSIRLRKAADMMVQGEQSLTEIMYSVGIQTQSYFSKAFKQEFGKTPTQFLKDLEATDKK